MLSATESDVFSDSGPGVVGSDLALNYLVNLFHQLNMTRPFEWRTVPFMPIRRDIGAWRKHSEPASRWSRTGRTIDCLSDYLVIPASSVPSERAAREVVGLTDEVGSV